MLIHGNTFEYIIMRGNTWKYIKVTLYNALILPVFYYGDLI